MKIYLNIFNKIISLENLFLAWDIFKKGKRNKKDVQIFERDLEKNIFYLHQMLKNKTYKHGAYTSFYIQDPRPRHIHKATVQDRVVHHALYSILYQIFAPTFIAHSFSCQINKGTHKGVKHLATFLRQASDNNQKLCFALKCDIKKFFASIDHQILVKIIKQKIKDSNALWLIQEIINSCSANYPDLSKKQGLPIGNLTSQLFANIYLDQLDQFIKHQLKIKYYLRYTDDFIIINRDIKYLENMSKQIQIFLKERLGLMFHPQKIIFRKYQQGVDFLGYICLPYHTLLRTKTKKRMFKKLRARVNLFKKGKISKLSLSQSLQSYLGMLKHCNSYQLKQKLKNQFWFWLTE